MADMVRSRGCPKSKGLLALPAEEAAEKVLTVAVLGMGSVETEREEEMDARRAPRSALSMEGGEPAGGDSEMGVETEGVAVRNDGEASAELWLVARMRGWGRWRWRPP